MGHAEEQMLGKRTRWWIRIKLIDHLLEEELHRFEKAA